MVTSHDFNYTRIGDRKKKPNPARPNKRVRLYRKHGKKIHRVFLRLKNAITARIKMPPLPAEIKLFIIGYGFLIARTFFFITFVLFVFREARFLNLSAYIVAIIGNIVINSVWEPCPVMRYFRFAV